MSDIKKKEKVPIKTKLKFIRAYIKTVKKSHTNKVIRKVYKNINDKYVWSSINKTYPIIIKAFGDNMEDHTNMLKNIMKWHYDYKNNTIRCNEILKYILLDNISIIYKFKSENYKFIHINIYEKKIYNSVNKISSSNMIFGEINFN